MQKIHIRMAENTREGWARTEYWLGAICLAYYYGQELVFLVDDNELRAACAAYHNEHGREPDWNHLYLSTIHDKSSFLREHHGHMWLLLVNAYESESSPGFFNTYHMVDSAPDEHSPHGHTASEQLISFDRSWDKEIVRWGEESGLMTDFYELEPTYIASGDQCIVYDDGSSDWLADIQE